MTKRRLKQLFNICGLIESQYERLLKEQGDKCKICNNKFSKNPFEICVDHCHKTNRVRGILCGKCNRALGLFNDNPTFIKRAIKWIQKGSIR
jgi:hypothetical protein